MLARQHPKSSFFRLANNLSGFTIVVMLTERSLLKRIEDTENEIRRLQGKVEAWRELLDMDESPVPIPQTVAVSVRTPTINAKSTGRRTGLKEAVLTELKQVGDKGATANEIMERLRTSGFELNGKRPIVNVTTTLNRMSAGKHPQAATSLSEGRRIYRPVNF
jgi:hypothetical protein